MQRDLSVTRARKLLTRLRYVGRDPVVQIAREGFFDLEYYRSQFGREAEMPATLDDAVRHYVLAGRQAGLAYSPFVEPEWWAGRERARVDAATLDRDFVRGWVTGVSPSPFLADAGPFGTARDGARVAASGGLDGRLTGVSSATHARSEMIARLAQARRFPPNVGTRSAVDWDAVRGRVNERVRDRVSILIPTYQDWLMTTESVRTALRVTEADDIEIVVVENGSRPAVLRMLTALFLAEPRVKIVACDVNTNFSGGMNRAIAESTGEYIVLLNNDALVEHGWWPPLRRLLRERPEVRGVQPLLLYPHIERIQAAGTMFLGEGVIPWHFLAGHPVEDLDRARTLSFAAVTAAILAFRASDLVAAEGFDEGFANGYEDVDLCLRMLTEPGHHFLVAPESRATHPEGSSEGRSLHDTANRRRFFEKWRGRMPEQESWRYEEVGLKLAALRPHWFVDDVPVMLSDPQLVRPRRQVLGGPGAGLPCLRWTLALTSEGDDGRVAALRAALTEMGQEVVSFRGGVRFVDGLDDVLVGFRPDAPYTPRAATFNVLWAPTGAPRPDTPDPVWEAVVADAADVDRMRPLVASGGELLVGALDDASNLRTVILWAARFSLARFPG